MPHAGSSSMASPGKLSLAPAMAVLVVRLSSTVAAAWPIPLPVWAGLAQIQRASANTSANIITGLFCFHCFVIVVKPTHPYASPPSAYVHIARPTCIVQAARTRAPPSADLRLVRTPMPHQADAISQQSRPAAPHVARRSWLVAVHPPPATSIGRADSWPHWHCQHATGAMLRCDA
jgi:hypothetical protein